MKGFAMVVVTAGFAAVSLAASAAPKSKPKPAPKSAPAPAPTPAAASNTFEPIAQVLLSPRCMNCHPEGNAPLQTDASRPHTMNVSRQLDALGASCQTCHRATNGAMLHQPPGSEHWRMPPAATPMTFQGKSAGQLCRDLKDPAKNGKRSMEDLVNHVSSDALVLWGWSPGPGRTLPPMTHDEFSAAFKKWADAGGPCP